MDKIHVAVAGETLAKLASMYGEHRLEVQGGQVQNAPYVSAITNEDGCRIIVHGKLEDLVEHIAAYLVYELQRQKRNLSDMRIEFAVAEQGIFEKPLKLEDKARFYEELLSYSENRMPTPFGITFKLTLPNGRLEGGILVSFYGSEIAKSKT